MRKLSMSRIALTLVVSSFLVLVVSSTGQYRFVDGPPEEFVGFPFIWAMDTVNSLSIRLSLTGLSANILVYFSTLYCLGIGINSLYTLPKKINKIVLGVAVAILLVAWMFALFINDVLLGFWLNSVFGQNVEELSFAFFPLIG